MPLIVETGEGVDGADAYASREAVETYWADRADPAFAAANEVLRDAAIRRATQFIDAEWGARFIGEKVDAAQALEWPRDDAAPFDVDEIPRKLIEATAELAKIALAGPIAGAGASGQAPSQSSIERMKAGSVEIAFRESRTSAIDAAHAEKFYLVERLLAPLLQSTGLNTGLAR